MITDQLSNITKKMQKFKQMKDDEIREQNIKQFVNQYSILVQDTDKLVRLLSFLKNNFDFRLTETESSALVGLLIELREPALTKTMDKFQLRKVNQKFKETEHSIKTHWNSFYFDYIRNTEEIIQLVSQIDTEGFKACLNDMKIVNEWTYNEKKYVTALQALSIAQNKLQALDLDDGVKKFLKLINERKATIKDLDENIRSWIEKEGLEDKFKISF